MRFHLQRVRSAGWGDEDAHVYLADVDLGTRHEDDGRVRQRGVQQGGDADRDENSQSVVRENALSSRATPKS